MRRLEFADRRKQAGITQRQFEIRMGWFSGALSLIETGGIRPESSQWDELETTLDAMISERESTKEACAT